MLTSATWWRSVSPAARWLLAAVVVTELGSGLTWPFTLIYLHEARRLPLDDVGVVLAAPALVALLVMGPAGALVDRVGAVPTVAVGLVLQAAGQLLMASATTFPAAVVAALVTGAAQAGTGPAFSTLIAQVVPSSLRQRYFAARFAAVNIGADLGPVIAGIVVDPRRSATFGAIYAADAVSFAAPLLVVLLPVRRLLSRRLDVGGGGTVSDAAAAADPPVAGQVQGPVDGPGTAGGSYRGLLRDRRQQPLLLLVVVASVVGFGQLDGGLPALGRILGEVSPRAIGWGFGVECALVAVLQLTVVERLEGRRRTRVLVGAAGWWVVCYTLLGATGAAPATGVATGLFALSLVAFAVAEALYVAPLMALINDLAPDHLRGRANSLASLAGQVGYGSGPLLAGALLAGQHPLLLAGTLVGGAAVVGVLALVVEPRLSPAVNGLVDAGRDDPAPSAATPST